jgi:hypothetical protein
MTNEIGKIVEAHAIARRAYLTIRENLFVDGDIVHVLDFTAALLDRVGPVQKRSSI